MPSKKKQTTKKSPKPEVANAEPPKPEPAEIPQETATAEERQPEVELAEAFSATLAQIQVQQQQLTGLKNQVRALAKLSMRELKAALKASRRSKRKASTRKPSGFVKPCPISAQLASFLGKPSGTSMARTEVTKEINAYIREHKLQDPNNGRHILPNQALKKLLNLAKTDDLTYFNLQRYMSPHFSKATSNEAAA